MKSTLSLFLFFVLCTAVALAEEDDLRSRVRDVFSVRSFFSNPESARRGESRQHLEEERAVQPRGACRGNSDDEDVELCEGCNIISKWHNDLEFDGAGGFLDVDFVELHQFWRFKSDHTLIIRRTYKVYVTQEFGSLSLSLSLLSLPSLPFFLSFFKKLLFFFTPPSFQIFNEITFLLSPFFQPILTTSSRKRTNASKSMLPSLSISTLNQHKACLTIPLVVLFTLAQMIPNALSNLKLRRSFALKILTLILRT